MNKTIALLLLLSLLLAGCGRQTLAPTPTTQPTNTPLPTDTPQPTATATLTATATPLPPTATLTPSPTATKAPTTTQTATVTEEASAGLPDPLDPPLKKSRAIPVMPGAIAGSEDGSSYSYTTDADREAVHQYYDRELVKLGWSPMAVGTGDKGPVMLFYTKSSHVVVITIANSVSGKTFVLITTS